MITYLGIHNKYPVYTIGGEKVGRIAVEISEEMATQYQDLIHQFEKMQETLHNKLMESKNAK